MSNFTKVESFALSNSSKNHLLCNFDIGISLRIMGIGETNKENNKVSVQNHAIVMILLYHHLYEKLKIEYLN